MRATSEWDEGREQMQVLMKRKMETAKAKYECKMAGTCPEFTMNPESGAFLCESGMAGNMPCKNVDQLSFVTFEEMGYGTPLPGDRDYGGNDVWGWTDPQNGDEYAIMGTTGGTGFVRVTDPRNPVPVAFVYSATGPSIWRDIKVIGNYAYIVAEARGHGLQVFDMTRLRGRNSLEYLTPDATNSDFGNAHNIVANEETNFLYVVGATQNGAGYSICRGGLLVLDVSNPLQPRYAGCFGNDGYVHDAQCVIYHGPDIRYTGREICFCFNENSLTLVDVEDKNNMRMFAKSGYINVAYTHQGWLTENHQFVLLDDEMDEYQKPAASQYTKTYMWDIRILDMPTLRSTFESSERSIDHNQYVVGDYTFQANYESGLRILHINEGAFALTNVGYFDVFPIRTTADFYGTWSVYPYFKSGTVLVSSIDYGLFMVKPDWEKIESLVKNGTDYAEQTRTRRPLFASKGAICPALVETKSCHAEVLC